MVSSRSDKRIGKNKPGCKVQDVQEGSKGIARHISNLRLVHERLVEEICSILLLCFCLLILALALGVLGLLLLHGRTGNVESHFDQLIEARGRLPSTVLGASSRLATRAIGFSGRESKFHRHFILSRQVGVGDLRVGDFKGRSVLDVEGELGLGELGLAPVPASQGMLAVLDVDSVPDFEGLGQPFKVLAVTDG